MTVRRDGTHTLGGHSTSHVSGKHSRRFACRIKENLDKQVQRLNRELIKTPTLPPATPDCGDSSETDGARRTKSWPQDATATDAARKETE